MSMIVLHLGQIVWMRGGGVGSSDQPARLLLHGSIDRVGGWPAGKLGYNSVGCMVELTRNGRDEQEGRRSRSST
jgi:hypothetical protein